MRVYFSTDVKVKEEEQKPAPRRSRRLAKSQASKEYPMKSGIEILHRSPEQQEIDFSNKSTHHTSNGFLLEDVFREYPYTALYYALHGHKDDKSISEEPKQCKSISVEKRAKSTKLNKK